MKIAFRIFTTLIFCLLLSACNGNKEATTSGRNSQSRRIWNIQGRRSGAHFPQNKHQYYCNPSEGILRIIDNEGDA